MLRYFLKQSGIKKERRTEREKNFALHSYFFRVHGDYLATHLIRFSFFQRKSLAFNLILSLFRYINLNALTSELASSESLQYLHNWLAYFPTHFIFLPLEASSLPFRTCPTELFAISQLKWTLALSSGSLALPFPLPLSLSIFLFRAAEMKWIKVTGSLWMLPGRSVPLSLLPWHTCGAAYYVFKCGSVIIYEMRLSNNNSCLKGNPGQGWTFNQS